MLALWNLICNDGFLLIFVTEKEQNDDVVLQTMLRNVK